MKTIIIIGATGFVGSHALNYLSKYPDINLIAACRDRTKLPDNFNGEVREGDIRNAKYLDRVLDDVDVVVNAMSWSSLFANRKNSNELFLQPSLKLINKFKQSNAQQYINISSTSVAAPHSSEDAMNPGKTPAFWPHLANVIQLENQLRELASKNKRIVNLRFGIFAGENYALGLLPILVPRLKTHLVPWVNGGHTGMPITDGRDIGQAMALAALNDSLANYESFNVVGPSIPTVREVIEFISSEYHLPKPHFSVPFFIAYPFAWLMEKLDVLVPWQPLIVRSIILLLEETNANNDKASHVLGYKPLYYWQDSIRAQMSEMSVRQKTPMKMAKPII